MTILEAISRLEQLPLAVRQFPTHDGHQLMAMGAASPIDGITVYDWACCIDDCGTHFAITLPTVPGPDFIVPTLEQAVSLIAFAYARHPITNGLSGRRLAECAAGIYQEWLKSR